MNFIAMDFETANRSPKSACSIALVVVRANKVVDSFYTLINPKMYFDRRNVQIHGIHESDVQDAPTFAEVWPHIAPLFDTNHLVTAHNARFDINVLRQSLQRFEILPPHYLAIDTLQTSRKLYPEFPNHRLNTVSAALKIQLQHHHNALADSIACAQILIHQVQQFGPDQLRPFIKLIA
ncbi:3'-5' exonuclease [Agrilactobacillus fermenti]|uniref:3'-5' exonuclease n=1 Tax=Agrilactobacillus fermenti TaxID=2586909 RepID=UPI001E44B1B3|nr:3'-5' exonuclease [Agrilactobacillus fermenti]MCD2256334.1 3'-5' exonuclease [Agrilactobacillus fermenti]